jgi:hypothetical protein
MGLVEFYFARRFGAFGGGDWVGGGLGMVRWMDGGLGKGGVRGRRAGFIRPF